MAVVLSPVTFTSVAAGGANSTIALTLAAADFATSSNGNAVRVTLACPATGSPITLNDVFIGHVGGANNFCFDGNQSRVTFNGGSSSVTLAVGGADVVSDPIYFNFDHTKALVTAYDYTTAGSVARLTPTLFSPTAGAYYFTTSATDAGTTAKTGYTSAGDFWDTVKEIEVFTVPQLDGAAVNANTFSITSSHSLSISTTVANDLILVAVGLEGSGTQQSVSSVTSSHLTFTKRASIQGSSGKMDVELWEARASGTLSSESITVTLT